MKNIIIILSAVAISVALFTSGILTSAFAAGLFTFGFILIAIEFRNAIMECKKDSKDEDQSSKDK